MGYNYILILVTCGSKREAERIASLLLAKRLVACANTIAGIESRFWWKGRIDKAKEFLIILKTRKANFKKIERAVKRIHSYEVPEMIALPIVSGNADYLNWIDGTLRDSRTSR